MKNNIHISDIIHGLRIAAMTLLIIGLTSIQSACDHSELWDEVPGEIANFINDYFPNSELQSVSHTGNTYHIRIDDGPGLTFDKDFNWTDINGYGIPIPQVLLFDQLPPQLYDYLQETEQLNSVFSISRDGDNYTLALLNSSLYFNAATGELRGSDATGSDVSKT